MVIGFASIPKPQPILHPLNPESQDPPEWLRLPPRPDEIPDDYEVENLDAHFRNSGYYNHEIDDAPSTPPGQLAPADAIPAELARLHGNLESRLKLFWGSSLPSRRIQVSIFLDSSDPPRHRHLEPRPLLTREMLTGPDGYFSDTFRVDWHDICTHLVGPHMTSNRTHVEHELLVKAQVINAGSTPELREAPINSIHIPITHSVVRVISDIDDTVKAAGVVDGARAIFNQVFVKDLEDSIIPGMGEWYSTMWGHGVRFHYVVRPHSALPAKYSHRDSQILPLSFSW